jgi:hypothetical protein
MNGCRPFLLAGLLASAIAASSALAQSVPTYAPSPFPSTPTADTTTVLALGTITKLAVSAPNAVIEWNRTLLVIQAARDVLVSAHPSQQVLLDNHSALSWSRFLLALDAH